MSVFLKLLQELHFKRINFKVRYGYVGDGIPERVYVSFLHVYTATFTRENKATELHFEDAFGAGIGRTYTLEELISVIRSVK